MNRRLNSQIQRRAQSARSAPKRPARISKPSDHLDVLLEMYDKQEAD